MLFRSYNGDAEPQFYPSFANSAPAGTTVSGVSANTVDAVITLTTQSTDVAPYIDLKKMNVVGVRYLINNMELDANQFVLLDPGSGYVNAARDTAAQALSGTAEANSTIKIYLNGSATAAYTTTANGSGAWSQAIGVLADGAYSYKATATDEIGRAHV